MTYKPDNVTIYVPGHINIYVHVHVIPCTIYMYVPVITWVPTCTVYTSCMHAYLLATVRLGRFSQFRLSSS